MRNTSRDGAEVTSHGRLFLTAGPAVSYALGQMVTHRGLGMTSLSAAAAATDDRRVQRSTTPFGSVV